MACCPFAAISVQGDDGPSTAGTISGAGPCPAPLKSSRSISVVLPDLCPRSQRNSSDGLLFFLSAPSFPHLTGKEVNISSVAASACLLCLSQLFGSFSRYLPHTFLFGSSVRQQHVERTLSVAPIPGPRAAFSPVFPSSIRRSGSPLGQITSPIRHFTTRDSHDNRHLAPGSVCYNAPIEFVVLRFSRFSADSIPHPARR